MQTVGEFDHQHAQIGRHGEHEFAEILGLFARFRFDFEAVQFGDAIHQSADFRAEQLFNFIERRIRILDRVVQQRGDDAGRVELILGEFVGDFHRVRKIRIAARALLRPVFLHGIDIGAVERVLIRLRVVCPDFVYQFGLSNHGVNIRCNAAKAKQSRV